MSTKKRMKGKSQAQISAIEAEILAEKKKAMDLLNTLQDLRATAKARFEEIGCLSGLARVMIKNCQDPVTLESWSNFNASQGLAMFGQSVTDDAFCLVTEEVSHNTYKLRQKKLKIRQEEANKLVSEGVAIMQSAFDKVLPALESSAVKAMNKFTAAIDKGQFKNSISVTLDKELARNEEAKTMIRIYTEKLKKSD